MLDKLEITSEQISATSAGCYVDRQQRIVELRAFLDSLPDSPSIPAEAIDRSALYPATMPAGRYGVINGELCRILSGINPDLI